MAYYNKRGDRGEKGDRGDAGLKGLKGCKGFKGACGDSGDAGEPGDAGDPGDAGQKGPKGDRGLKGDAGDPGPKGETGDKGLKGLRGRVGDRGLRGIKGDRGLNGDAGERGPKGDTGDKGIDGLPGPKGLTGPRGDIGPDGNKGKQGPKGDPGTQGEPGPRGIEGIPGDTGVKGDKGLFGEPGQCIASPSEVILAKIGGYISNERFKCYIEINSPIPLNAPGVSGATNAEGINNSNLGYIEMQSGNLMGIKNIESIHIVINKVETDRKNRIVREIGEIFDSFYDCLKLSPESVNVNDIGEPVSTGNLRQDFEYTRVCRCSSDIDNICVCRGDKVDICIYRGSKHENLKKIIERARDNGKTIEAIITSKPNFTNLTNLVSPINIEAVSSGGVVLSYDVNERGEFTIISIVALEKIMAIKFMN